MRQGIRQGWSFVLGAAGNISNRIEKTVLSSDRDYVLLISLILLVASIYSNSLYVPFLFDDAKNIHANPSIQLTEFSVNNIWNAARNGHLANRPVANISFALNYYIDGYHVGGYHFVNILIHIISGIFLYAFIVITGKIYPRSAIQSRAIPFFATAIWLVHPIQTQSVTYIVQRMNSMAAMFYISAMFLYAKARRGMIANQNKSRNKSEIGNVTFFTYPLSSYLCLAGCLLSGIMALGTKEIAATLPFFLFLYEWYFCQDMRIDWLKRNGLRFSGVLLIVILVAIIYLGENPLTKIGSMYDRRDFTMIERLLTEFRVVVFYIGLLLFPHPSRLNLEHDFSLSTSLLNPISTLLCLGILAFFFIFSLFIAKRERLLSFCILWYLGNLVIESSVVGLEIIFEHRLYLPSMLFSLMAVLAFYRVLRCKWLSAVLLCSVVAVFSFWSYARNGVWKDEITLLTDCVAKSPNKFRPHYNLGIALAEKGRTHEAVNHYMTALRIGPDHASLHTNLGLEFFLQGKRGLAIDHYKQALRIQPDFIYAHINLASALFAEGEMEQSMMHCKRALQIKPNSAQAFNCIGNIYYNQGRITDAIIFYSKAIQNDKHYAEAANNLGVALMQAGRIEQAIHVLQTVLKIKPDYREARNNLEKIQKDQKRNDLKKTPVNRGIQDGNG